MGVKRFQPSSSLDVWLRKVRRGCASTLGGKPPARHISKPGRPEVSFISLWIRALRLHKTGLGESDGSDRQKTGCGAPSRCPLLHYIALHCQRRSALPIPLRNGRGPPEPKCLPMPIATPNPCHRRPGLTRRPRAHGMASARGLWILGSSPRMTRGGDAPCRSPRRPPVGDERHDLEHHRRGHHGGDVVALVLRRHQAHHVAADDVEPLTARTISTA